MKNKTLLKYLFLFLVAGTTFTSCNSDDDTTPIAYETADISKFDLSTGQATAGGKIWDKTFTEDVLEIGVFDFSHYGAVMPTYKYWNGFTVSNSSDNTDQSTKQGGWTENQWGTMPEGGVTGKGTPFIVVHADEKPADGVLVSGQKVALENFNSWVKIDEDNTNSYTAQSISLAMSPWPYYGILNGDDYSRKFVKGDYFALHIYGLDKDQKLVAASPVTHYFVDFRNDITPINTKWSTVDLKSLGEVKYLVFFLETTDVGQYGANTALYFTMDRLTVEKVVK